jgi:hypothetical protein
MALRKYPAQGGTVTPKQVDFKNHALIAITRETDRQTIAAGGRYIVGVEKVRQRHLFRTTSMTSPVSLTSL